jgi:aminomethyltransferase
MPVQYTSIVDEHLAVRSAAGLFDISHMGELLVSGPAAESFLNQALTNDIRKLVPGQGQYTLCCNERGGVIDDLYAYRLAAAEYLLIVNASRIEADASWLEKQLARFEKRSQVTLRNTSDVTGALAVQGPKVAGFIDACFPGPSSSGTEVAKPSELQKNQVAQFSFEGLPVWVSRTGYTGEDGFEVGAPADRIVAVWDKVRYPLYGHELDEDTTPIEAGLGFFVALDKGEFIGRDKLAQQKSNGVKKKLVAFKMTDRCAPPRPHYPIWSTGPQPAKVGEVVSGTQSPSLGIGVGMGYVPPELAKPQTPIAVEIRGKQSTAIVVAKPFYRKAG